MLLSALSKAIGNAGDTAALTRKKIENYYLFNSEETDELKYKLLLGKGDRDTLAAVVDDRPQPQTASLRIVRNYELFVQRIQASPHSLDVLLTGLQKLVIVDIALNRDYDNPQLIFESLNSTGLELSQADLVRNFVLMGLEPVEQNKLYKDHWFPMEQGFGLAAYAVYFDRFMRDYLTVKTGRIANLGDVYDDFKTYVRSSHLAVDPLVAEAGEVRELRTEVFMPWIERLWDTPNVAHDNPIDQRFHASLILGFADADALRAFFGSGEIATLSGKLPEFASAVHAYEVTEVLTYVKDGKVLPHYQP